MGFARDFAEKITIIWVHAMVRPKPVRPSSRPGSSWFILGESSPFVAQQFRLLKYDNLPRCMVDEWWLYHDFSR